MSLFPDEIISEFLIRLPTKDLCRFKSVSKRWSSIIGNPHFISSYVSYAHPSWFFFERNIHLTPNGSPTRFSLTPRPAFSTLTVNQHLLCPNETVLTDEPAQIVQSSNGLVLFGFGVDAVRDGHVFVDTSLFVGNPVTGECAPIPKPNDLPVGVLSTCFVSRVDPGTSLIDKFVVVEYHFLLHLNAAMVRCFSSDTGKWVVKKTEYVLPLYTQHHFFPHWPFEFDGHMFWTVLNIGLITWDVSADIFTDSETVDEAKCRLIPLPKGQERPFSTVDMFCSRSFRGIDRGGGCKQLQYVELFETGDCMLKCWRLKDHKKAISEWSLVYKVPRVDVAKCLGHPCGTLKTFSLHPQFEPDSVYFCLGECVFSFNFRSRKLESCVMRYPDMNEYPDFIPFLLPRWPISIPPRLYACYAKEEGSVYFKEKKFTKAIESYSKSIALSPNAVVYANRAMAYLKINSFSKAEDDCTEALKIDNNNIKVYARRAAARKELGNLEGSKEDAEFALTIEPNNEYVKNLYADVKSLLDERSYAESGYEMDMAD